MGSLLSMLSNQNMMYYLIVAYFVLTLMSYDSPKKEKAPYLRNEHHSRPRLQNRKRWLESEIQLLHDELAQVSHELEEPLITDSVRAAIRSEIRAEMRAEMRAEQRP